MFFLRSGDRHGGRDVRAWQEAAARPERIRSAQCTAQGRRCDLTCQKRPACVRVSTFFLISTGLIARLRLVAPSIGTVEPPSRTGRPSHTAPWHSATRRGGMAVHGITIGCDQVAADTPAHVALRLSPLYATSPSRSFHLRIRSVERIPD